MVPAPGAALQPFVNRLASRSVLTEEEQRALLGLGGRLKNVASHIDFVCEGQRVDHASLVVSGLVGRFGQNRDGVRQITCLHIPGDMADLPSVVVPKACWGLAALTDTTILEISHSDLRRVAAEHPGLAEAFLRDCAADGSILAAWVVNIGRRGAVARLAHLFCEMAVRCERAGQGHKRCFDLPLTQSDLGDATGLTAVHVNRTLRELRSRTLISTQAAKVIIYDWERLVTTGGFDDAFMLFEA